MAREQDVWGCPQSFPAGVAVEQVIHPGEDSGEGIKPPPRGTLRGAA